MRGGSGANPRQQWYDRNPVMVASGYSAAVAPHAAVDRWTYTVPAGKKANVEFSFASVTKATLSTTTAVYRAQTRYIPSGGASVGIIIAEQYLDAIGSQAMIGLGGAFIMGAGDFIAGRTVDSNGDGTVLMQVSFKATEYDA